MCGVKAFPLVLAAQAGGDDRGQTAQNDAFGVDQDPLPSRFGIRHRHPHTHPIGAQFLDPEHALDLREFPGQEGVKRGDVHRRIGHAFAPLVVGLGLAEALTGNKGAGPWKSRFCCPRIAARCGS
jgi:hypothetical protein